jgi:hypothetical protein
MLRGRTVDNQVHAASCYSTRGNTGVSSRSSQSLMWPHVNGLGCVAAVLFMSLIRAAQNRLLQARHSISAGSFFTRCTELMYVVLITRDASLFQFQFNRTVPHSGTAVGASWMRRLSIDCARTFVTQVSVTYLYRGPSTQLVIWK